jgi:hypothetical protein
MLMPDKADLALYQGDDYAARVTVQDTAGNPADITGYTAAAQIRRDVADNSNKVAAEFGISVESPYIYLSLASVETQQLPAGSYVWDLQVTAPAPSGRVSTVLAGAVTVRAEVTRELEPLVAGNVRRMAI